MNLRLIKMIPLLLLFSASYAKAIIIEGNVEDVVSKEPLPYANIAIAGTDRGTISNQNGRYALEIEKTENILIVSYIGYKTDTINVDIDIDDGTIILPITLTPEPIVMREVIVTAGYNYAEELLASACEKIRQEWDELSYRQAFYRQYTATDSIYLSVWEMFYNLLANQNGIEEWSIKQGREASLIADRSDLYWGEDNFSYIAKAFKATQSKESILSFLPLIRRNMILAPIRPDPGKYYDCSIEGYRTQDGRSVAIISVTPREKYDRPLMGGTVEIFEDDCQLLRFELAVSHPDLNSIISVPRTGPFSELSLYPEDTGIEFTMTYRQVAEDVWDLDRIEIDVANRVLSKTDPDFDRYMRRHLVMLFYGYDAAEKYVGASLSPIDRIAIREELEYDPDFWEKNTAIIDEVPMEEEIVQFFKEHAFHGNALPGAASD